MLLLGTLSMCHSVAPLSGAAQCDIAIAIYRISLSFAGNELGNAETSGVDRITDNKTNGGDFSDLICASGQRRTNTLVVRTYARWPLRASGVLDPLARTGPASIYGVYTTHSIQPAKHLHSPIKTKIFFEIAG